MFLDVLWYYRGFRGVWNMFLVNFDIGWRRIVCCSVDFLLFFIIFFDGWKEGKNIFFLIEYYRKDYRFL